MLGEIRESWWGEAGTWEWKHVCEVFKRPIDQSNPSQPNPGLAKPNEVLLLLLPVSFSSIRYTQGKQEGIRMGPDRHLVCWEISLGQSERLPSPLPAPAHQMWGEGHITSFVLSGLGALSLFLLFLTSDGKCTVEPNSYYTGMRTHVCDLWCTRSAVKTQ